MQKLGLLVPYLRNIKKFVLIMKLCTLILFISLATASAKTSYSQNTKFTLNLERVTIKELFDKIEKNSEFIFVYYDNIIDLNKEISVKANDETVEEILEGVFKSSENIFKIFDRQIVIAKNESSEADLATLLAQQPKSKEISGTVRDSKGQTIPGATILVKGTTTGITTDNGGEFRLSVPLDTKILVISFVGMESQEISIGTLTRINVIMAESVIGLDEVVVTALGITKEKKSLAYSISEVKSEDLVKGGNANLIKSLDGKMSGVNLTNLSSDPTSSVLVNIRGTTAIPSASNANVSIKGQPLYVIDGIPVGNQTLTSKNGVDFGNILSQLNPEDIENITILKGGSAGALYGSEGGNGVVMITTKSGKGGRKGIGVSVSSVATMDSPYQFIDVQNEFGQGNRATDWAVNSTSAWGPKLDGTTTARFWNVKTQSWDEGPQISYNENRIKAYLQTGSTVTTNININGNYDKGSFRLSLTNMGNKGVMPNTTTNQKSITINSEYKLTDKIKISANSSYVRTYSPNKANVSGPDGVLNTLLLGIPPNLQPLSEMKEYWLKGFEGIRMNGVYMNDNGIDIFKTENPWWTTYEKINRFSRDNFFGKLQLDWQLNKEFAFVLRSGMMNVRENYEYRQSFGKQSLANRAASGDGMFQTNTNNSLNFNSDAILSYNKSIGKFNITAVGGVNYVYSNSNSYSVSAGALSVPGLFTIANAFPGTLTANYSWGAYPSYSVYGTADIAWNKQVFVGITGRNDWKGNLDEEKINYFYPSVSAAWVASETFALPKMFDLFKVRLGLANVGNGLTRSRSVDTYSFESPDWSGSVKTANINASLVDPNIKTMQSITKEAGMDVWMFNKKLQFDFTYFIKDQNNQLGAIPLVQGTGFASMLTNIGDARSEGYEGGLTINPIRTKDWNWAFSASYTHYKSHILHLSPQFAPNGYIFAAYANKTVVKIAEGEEIGNIYEENPILRVQSGEYAGLPLLSSVNGGFQKSSNAKDRVQIANYNPDFILGLNTTLRYKRFSLNVVGSLRKGGEYISINSMYLEDGGLTAASLSSGPDNPWWKGGRNAELGGMPWPATGSSDYAKINASNATQRSDFNDASYVKGVFLNPVYTGDPAKATDADYIVNGANLKNTFYNTPANTYDQFIWSFCSTRVFDATNFKLREVSLNYTLPGSVTSKLKVNNINISLIGRNIFQWNASGRNEDPESAFINNGEVGNSQGVLRAGLPSIRSIGFKLAFDF